MMTSPKSSSTASTIFETLESHDIFTTTADHHHYHHLRDSVALSPLSSDIYVLSQTCAESVELRTLSLTALKSQPSLRYKVIECDPPLSPRAHSLVVSPHGDYVCVQSDSDVQVVVLPKPGIEASLATRYETIRCRTHTIGSFDMTTTTTTTTTEDNRHIIQQVLWHPQSRDGTHLLILHAQQPSSGKYSQSVAMYDVLADAKAQWRIPLVYPPATVDTLFSSMTLGVSTGWNRFTLYLSHASAAGDVYALCPVVPKGCALSEQAVNALEGLFEDGYADPSMVTVAASQVPLCRLWMDQTWIQLNGASAGAGGDGVGDHQEYIASPPVQCLPLLQGPFSIAPKLDDHSGIDEKVTCHRIHCLPTHQLQRRQQQDQGREQQQSMILGALMRVFSNGDVDTLIQFAPMLPALTTVTRRRKQTTLVAAAPSPVKPQWPLLAFDRVQLHVPGGVNNVVASSATAAGPEHQQQRQSLCRVLTDRYEPETVVIEHHHGVHVVSLPWLVDLWSTVSSPSAIAALVDEVSSPAAWLTSVNERGVDSGVALGALVVSDPVVGRMCVTRRQGQQGVRVYDLTPFVRRAALASTLEPSQRQQRQQQQPASSAAASTTTTAAAAATTSSKFADQLRTLLDKYTSPDRAPPVRLSDVAHMNLNDPQHLQTFFKRVRDPVNRVVQDMKEVQTCTTERLGVLEKIRRTQEVQFTTLNTAIRDARAANHEILKQLKAQSEVQHLLVQRAEKVAEAQARYMTRPSKAELEFQASLQAQKRDMQLLQYNIADTQRRAQRLQTLHTQVAQVAHNIGGGGGGGIHASVQTQMNDELSRQMTVIKECLNAMREIKANLETIKASKNSS